MDYIFCHPWQYDPKSTGIRAWYILMDQLRAKGFHVIFVKNHEITQATLQEAQNRIAVYSDTTTGNPLRSSRVVRWLEYYPDFFGVPTHIGPDELIFVWEYIFYPAAKYQLQVDTIEPFFNDKNIEVKDIKNAYYVGKANLQGTPVCPPIDAILIRQDWPEVREELANLLRRVKTLYCFDKNTMLSEEALRCGCEVILPNNIKAEPLPKQNYSEMLDNFIKITQETYGDKA